MRLLLVLVTGWLLGSPPLWAGGQVHFVAHSQISAQSKRLFGEVTLTLQGEEIQAAQVWVHGPSGPQPLREVPRWKPEEKQTVAFDFPTHHARPGWYHLLVEIHFQDQSGVRFASAMGAEYRVGEAPRSQSKPAIILRGDRLEWPTPPLREAALTLTTGPHWRMEHAPLTPADDRLGLLPRSPEESPLLGWSYPQIARLDWVEGEWHQSRIFQWLLRTDNTGQRWQGENLPEPGPTPPAEAAPTAWAPSALLLLLALALLTLFLNRRLLREGLRTLLRR